MSSDCPVSGHPKKPDCSPILISVQLDMQRSVTEDLMTVRDPEDVGASALSRLRNAVPDLLKKCQGLRGRQRFLQNQVAEAGGLGHEELTEDLNAELDVNTEPVKPSDSKAVPGHDSNSLDKTQAARAERDSLAAPAGQAGPEITGNSSSCQDADVEMVSEQPTPAAAAEAAREPQLELMLVTLSNHWELGRPNIAELLHELRKLVLGNPDARPAQPQPQPQPHAALPQRTAGDYRNGAEGAAQAAAVSTNAPEAGHDLDVDAALQDVKPAQPVPHAATPIRSSAVSPPACQASAASNAGAETNALALIQLQGTSPGAGQAAAHNHGPSTTAASAPLEARGAQPQDAACSSVTHDLAPRSVDDEATCQAGELLSPDSGAAPTGQAHAPANPHERASATAPGGSRDADQHAEDHVCRICQQQPQSDVLVGSAWHAKSHSLLDCCCIHQVLQSSHPCDASQY